MVRSICIYCASSDQIPQPYFQAAVRLGQLLARHHITLVNGAGNMGLMRASADACMAAGGQTLGIIPRFMVDEGWAHPGMTRLIVTPDMHTRQQQMMRHSDAAIILPGGFGTLAEFTELVTWKQLGLYLKPIILLNTDHYYTPHIQALLQGADQNFLRHRHMDTFQVAATPDEALHLALHTPQWDTNIRRFAKI